MDNIITLAFIFLESYNPNNITDSFNVDNVEICGE